MDREQGGRSAVSVWGQAAIEFFQSLIAAVGTDRLTAAVVANHHCAEAVARR